MELTNKGYQPNTPQQVREELAKRIEQNVPDFQTRPADLLNNLLNESVPILMYVENLIFRLFNGYSPSFANEQFLQFQGANFGIEKKSAYKSSVDLEFSGGVGSVVPKGLKVQNTQKNVTFETIKESIIGTTGKVVVSAISNDKNTSGVNVGDLTIITTAIKGLTVTNITAPSLPVDAESNAEYRARVQQRFRCPKVGSYGLLLNGIEGVEGVIPRTLAYKLKEVTVLTKTYDALEIIVDGGDPLAIVGAMYLYGGLTTRRFLSEPSKSETARTITQNLIINGQTHTYKFTRPKRIDIVLKVSFAIVNVDTTNNSIKVLTQETMQNYINSLRVGVRPNIQSLTEQFLKGFALAGGSALNINQKEIKFEVKDKATTTAINFDAQGFLEIDFDNYLTLAEYEVQIG